MLAYVKDGGNMKKIIHTMLALLMLTSLVACSSGGTTSTSSDETSTTSTVATAETKTDSKLSVSGKELYNDGGITITLKDSEINPNNIKLPLLIENESGQTIVVQTRNVSINDVMAEGLLSAEVAPGKKSNESLDLYLLDSRISFETVSKIEFSFYIFDNDSWDEIVETESIIIETSDNSYVYVANSDGEIIYDENNIKVVYQGLNDDLFGIDALFYIENNSSEPICVQTRDSSINGFMIDSIMSSEIAPGKKTYTDMSFLSSELEENDLSLDNFENLEFSFHIFNDDTWDTIADTGVITITSK